MDVENRAVMHFKVFEERFEERLTGDDSEERLIRDRYRITVQTLGGTVVYTCEGDSQEHVIALLYSAGYQRIPPSIADDLDQFRTLDSYTLHGSLPNAKWFLKHS